MIRQACDSLDTLTGKLKLRILDGMVNWGAKKTALLPDPLPPAQRLTPS